MIGSLMVCHSVYLTGLQHLSSHRCCSSFTITDGHGYSNPIIYLLSFNILGRLMYGVYGGSRVPISGVIVEVRGHCTFEASAP